MKSRFEVLAVAAILILAAWCVQAPRAYAQVVPPQWINIYGRVIDSDNQPVAAGTLVEALDPSGTVCGSFHITTAGAYGLLACDMDDPTTPARDGVVGGDTVSIRVGGVAAKPSLTLPAQIAMGDLFEVDLTVEAAPIPEPVAIPEPSSVMLVGLGLVGLAGYIRMRRGSHHTD